MEDSRSQFQLNVVHKIEDFFDNTTSKKAVVVMGTGSGKTRVFDTFVANNLLKNGQRSKSKRILILANNIELLHQANRELNDKVLLSSNEYESLIDNYITHFEHGNKKENYLKNLEHKEDVDIVFSTNVTLFNRLSDYDNDWFDYIIIDECHHTGAETYQQILKHFSHANVLGVTATPYRTDGFDLFNDFTCLVDKPLSECYQEGWTVPVIVKQAPTDFTTNKIYTNSSDTIANNIENIADDIITDIPDRKTVLCIDDISHAQELYSTLKEMGYDSTYIYNSKMPAVTKTTNKEAFEKCDKGIMILIDALGEGWDCPDINCVINLSHTMSERQYRQFIGRGARKADGKEDCLLYAYDFIQRDEKRPIISVRDIPFDKKEDFEVSSEERKIRNDVMSLLIQNKKEINIFEAASNDYPRCRTYYDLINNTKSNSFSAYYKNLFLKSDNSSNDILNTIDNIRLTLPDLTRNIKNTMLLHSIVDNIQKTGLFESQTDILSFISSTYNAFEGKTNSYNLLYHLASTTQAMSEVYLLNKDVFQNTSAESFFSFDFITDFDLTNIKYANYKNVKSACNSLKIPLTNNIAFSMTTFTYEALQKYINMLPQHEFLSKVSNKATKKIDFKRMINAYHEAQQKNNTILDTTGIFSFNSESLYLSQLNKLPNRKEFSRWH